MAVNITLNEISEQLKSAEESEKRQEEHLEIIADYFVRMTRGGLDRAETAYEKKPQGTLYQQGIKAGEDFDILKALGLGALGANLGSLVAGIGALTASLAGLRGWETAALGQIKQLGERLRNVFRPITSIGDDLDETVKAATKAGGLRAIGSNLVTKITTAAEDLTRTILAGFGIDPETGKMARNAKGQFDGKEVKTTALMIEEAMGALKLRVFSLFGLTSAGALTADAAKISEGGSTIATKLTTAFDKLMSPIRAIGTAFDTYIAGPGAKLFGFLDGVLGITQGAADAGKFFKFMGRLLWPLGIFMSLLDGIEAYKNTEGSEWEKFTAGISAFIGDFLGAPLDLLKNGLAWVLGKFGFNEESEQIKNFNIEEKITNLIQSVLDFPAKAFEWIKTLFSDPTTALKQLWEGIMAIVPGAVGAATTLIDIVWWPVNQFIDWVTKKLGWRSEDAPDFNLRESITGWVTDFWNWFTSWLPDINKIANSLVEKVRSILPDWVVDNVGINYTQSGNDRTRTDMMENDDAVMRQQVIGGPQKTYTTRADIAQALSFNYDAYKSMNEGGDPYARQLPAAPIIIQDNSRSSGGTAQLFMNNDASSTDTSYYQRRLSMGLGV